MHTFTMSCALLLLGASAAIAAPPQVTPTLRVYKTGSPYETTPTRRCDFHD